MNEIIPKDRESTPSTAGSGRARLIGALALAVIVDVVQCPASLAWLSGVGGPVEWLVNEGLDIVTMGALTALVGFHWSFLPAFVVESLPVADLAPTWTASLLFARRKELRSLFSRTPTPDATGSALTAAGGLSTKAP